MKLILGDCLEKMADLPTATIDAVICDPPYGTTACKWDSVIPFEPMWKELKRITKPNAAICLFGSEPFSSRLRMSNLKCFRYDWVWIKERGTGIGNARRMPLKRHELISVFYASKPTYFYLGEPLEKPYSHVLPIGENGTAGLSGAKSIGANRNQRPVHIYTHKTKNSVLEFRRDNMAKGKSFHPTQKPVALLEYLVNTYTNPGDIVLDFTMGSGSTGVACKRLGRLFIGIEKDIGYFEIAKRRIAEAAINQDTDDPQQELPLEGA